MITDSAFLTGLIGAAELVPLAAGSLYGGALADRFDRRTLLLACQLALVAVAALLSLAAISGEPPVWILYVLAAAMAGASAVERVVRAAIVPNTVEPERLRGALSLTYGLYQLTQVVGPGVGGLLIAAFGISVPYAVDAVSCLGMAAAAAAMSPQPVAAGVVHEPVLRSIRTGLAFVRGLPALMGSFVIDLSAMTFGMPRALFPVLAADRLPRRRQRHRPALRGGRRRLDRRRADHRLAPPRPLPGPDRARRGRRLGRLHRPRRPGRLDLARGGLLRRSPAPPTASAPSAARRSPRPSPPTACAAG